MKCIPYALVNPLSIRDRVRPVLSEVEGVWVGFISLLGAHNGRQIAIYLSKTQWREEYSN